MKALMFMLLLEQSGDECAIFQNRLITESMPFFCKKMSMSIFIVERKEKNTPFSLFYHNKSALDIFSFF